MPLTTGYSAYSVNGVLPFLSECAVNILFVKLVIVKILYMFYYCEKYSSSSSAV